MHRELQDHQVDTAIATDDAGGVKPATATLPPAEANHLVTEHLELVQHVVNQVATRYPRHVDREELWNAGAEGLVDASRRYDPSTGIPFGRYAMIRIRGAIIDSTRSRDWATRTLRREMREVRKATEEFEASEGRTPASVELAERLGISVDELAAHRSAAVSASLLHLDQRIASDESDATLGDTVTERSADVLPEAKLEERELVGTLRTAVTHLPEVQREVVERYYFGGEYLRDIADSMGVTEARVSQIRSEALNAMRALFGEQFDGVPSVPENAPGRRARTAFVANVAAQSTWRSRLEAADYARQRSQTRIERTA